MTKTLPLRTREAPTLLLHLFQVALLFVAAMMTTVTLAAAQAMLTITPGNGDAAVELSEESFSSLPQSVIETGNEFVDGIARFEGPKAIDVLEGIMGSLDTDTVEAIRFIAANDYQVDVPLKDLSEYGVILATHMNGMRLSRRDKGPIWLIYPMTEFPELQNSIYNARLIWQVTRIEVPASAR